MINEDIFFRQATLKLFSSLNMETALHRLRAYIQTHFTAEGILLGVYDPDTNSSRMAVGIFPEDMPQPPQKVTFPHQIWEWMKQTWAEPPDIRIMNDLEQESPEMKKAVSHLLPEEISFIDYDLELEGRRLGFFVVFSRGRHQYKKEHAALVKLLHDPMVSAITNALRHQEIQQLKDLLEDDYEFLNRRMLEISGSTIIGADFGLSGVMEQVRQVAPADSPVILMGETGVGKEVIANAIHNASRRKGRPLIKVNCGAIPDSLIDSELFGHEKGAFTGAVSRRRGLFERADTGTIFLDEIGELPLAVQVRLLRVLQEKQIERVGGTSTIPVDVRVISATHRNLDEMIEKGLFREDLWFRLNVFPIIIPPLRRRPEDIPALVSHFMEKKAAELKIYKPESFSPARMEQLRTHDWPGNIRELENYVERALITGRREAPRKASKGRGPKNTAAEKRIPGAGKILDQVIREHIEQVLKDTGGKVEGDGGAAKHLGLHPSTLRAKMRKLGIAFGRRRNSSRLGDR